MKTYVITLSQVFPTWHKRAGEPTKFRAAFLSGQTCSKCKKRNHAMCTSECFSGLKIHTIRANYPLWLKRITEVQQGKAVLSVRQWSGKPTLKKSGAFLKPLTDSSSREAYTLNVLCSNVTITGF